MSEEPWDGAAATCPAWCVLPHEDVEAPAEVIHEAAAHLVPGIVTERHAGVGDIPRRQPVAVELSVVRYCYQGDHEEWIYIGDGHSGLDLSPESARRLARTVLAALEDLELL
ncbi:hypothetical protein J5X07_03955 [Actinomyces bowdenii]|uniref:DUF6907 domain-containing protein n=1 Tax=Actinomyces bowdenii TaxID=131109 RepID=UPI001ABCC968|nr:hypothetical protein [Actinomyces bowdenii]MBO3724190.1 hypothetical protein [Actinomyces bowdenii]